MAEAVFLDSSFFKGLIDPSDDFYHQAGKIWIKFQEGSKNLITSNFIVDECLTLLRSKCNLETAIKFRNLLAENSNVLKIVRVTAADEAGAWKWFVKNWSKLSFTDCVSFALMKRLEIEQAASFDDHFNRVGFKLA
jgi:hypothetical protein